MAIQITTRELSAIEDQLSQEQILVKKYQTMAEQMTDPELKTKCSQIADKHQQHFDTLFTYLQG